MKKLLLVVVLIVIIVAIIIFLPGLNSPYERSCNNDSDCTFSYFCGQPRPINKFSLSIQQFSDSIIHTFPQVMSCLNIPATFVSNVPTCLNNQCSVKYSLNCILLCNNYDKATYLNDSRFQFSALRLNMTISDMVNSCNCAS